MFLKSLFNLVGARSRKPSVLKSWSAPYRRMCTRMNSYMQSLTRGSPVKSATSSTSVMWYNHRRAPSLFIRTLHVVLLCMIFARSSPPTAYMCCVVCVCARARVCVCASGWARVAELTVALATAKDVLPEGELGSHVVLQS